MLLILQRYYFESESQQNPRDRKKLLRCCLSYKDTILKANHNSFHLERISTLMLLILQRYYFESESQPHAITHGLGMRCCLSYKDTILKANHNSFLIFFFFIVMLLILQRYYFESESQLITRNQ